MLTGDHGVPWATGEGLGKTLAPVVDCWHCGTRSRKVESRFLGLSLTRLKQAPTARRIQVLGAEIQGQTWDTCVSQGRCLAFSVLPFTIQRILSSVLVSFDCQLNTGQDYLEGISTEKFPRSH